MRVLVITGDNTFGPGHPRYDLQKSAVDALGVVYWGRRALLPRIPPGPWDVITAQDPFWRGRLAGHLAWWFGAKLNIQVHTDLDAQPLWRRVFARIQLRHADSVRVVSQKIKEQVLRAGVRTKISVLPVFVDISKFRNIIRQPDDKTILWVGRFEPEKDPGLALEIIKKVPGAKLIMLGKGSLEPILRAHVARCHLATRVEFAGWQDPVPYLTKAAVVLCTSRHESFGVSMIEALAAGVPVVAPDVGVAKEAGATVVPREKLAGAISQVLQSGAQGHLKLRLLTKEEWVRAWRETLI
jgi:glycosyltransferase involved in cell wall biosynthesis